MPERSRDDSLQLLHIDSTHHRMGLATARLPIGEDGSVVAQEDVLYKAICSFRVYKLLCRVLGKHMIKSEIFCVVRIVCFDQLDLVVLLVGMDDALAPSLLLFSVHRTNSDHDFDGFTHFYGRFDRIIITLIR